MSRYAVAPSVVTVVLLGVAVGLIGCGGGGGPAPGNVTLGVVATGAQYTPSGAVGPADEAAPPLLVVALPGGEKVELDQANVGVKDVDLETAEEAAEPEATPADDDDIELEGPYVADVVNEVLRNPDGTVAWDISTNFPPGTVLEEAELDIAAIAGVCPDNASGVSIHLHGTYRDNADVVVYNFHLDSGVALELDFDDDEGGGIVIDDENLLSLIFAAGNWFDGVDLSTANTSVVDGNGDVLFDGSNNTGLRDAIVSNILAQLTFAEDNDEDGDPDDTF